MKTTILDILEEHERVQRNAVQQNLAKIVTAAEHLATCLTSGHKVLVFGNGGSAADAQHLAAEFVNRFRVERKPLAAIALTTDASIITSIGNDYTFDDIFSKQIMALGNQHDVAVGISTSGNSTNVIRAVETAGHQGLFTIGLTGRGGTLAAKVDLALKVESDVTARVQETHILMLHMLCELIDRILFAELFPPKLNGE